MGLGRGNGKLFFNGYKVCVGDHEKALDIHNCDDYTNTGLYLNARELYTYKWLN